MDFPRSQSFPVFRDQNGESSSSRAGSGFSSGATGRSPLDGSDSAHMGSTQYSSEYIHYTSGPQNNPYYTPAPVPVPEVQYSHSRSYMPMYGSVTSMPMSEETPSGLHSQGPSTQYYPENYPGNGTMETPPTPDSLREAFQQYGADNAQGIGMSDRSLDLQGLEVGTEEDQHDISGIGAHASIYNDPMDYAYTSERTNTTTAAVGGLSSDEPPWSAVNPQHDKHFPGVEGVLFAPSPGPVYDWYHHQEGLLESDHFDTGQLTPRPIAPNAPFNDDDLGEQWHHYVPEEYWPSFSFDELTSDAAVDGLSPLSTTTNSTCVSKGGRAHGFHLNEAGAQNAKQMRKEGVCWHCYFMRKKCSPGEPCEPCQDIVRRSGFRTFQLPCDKSKLQDRTALLLPKPLVSHLRKAEVLKFFRDNIQQATSNRFKLPLTVGYGRNFLFDAFEFIPNPENTELSHSIGVEIDIDSQTSRRVKRKTACVALFLASDLMRTGVDQWLNGIIASDLQNWPGFFCGQVGFSWQRRILEAVCQYFDDSARSMEDAGVDQAGWPEELATLRRALKLWILVFLMSHQLMIPEEDRPTIERILNVTLPPGPVSPRLPNRIVKSILRPMIVKLASDVLAGLHSSFRRKGRDIWATVFCTVLLLLTVAADIEISLDDIAACAVARGDLSRSRPGAALDMQNLEEDVPNVIIELFHARFRSPKSFNPFRPQGEGLYTGMDSKTERFVRNISEAVTQDPLCTYPWPDLKDMQCNQLAAFNVARLLSKFLRPFFDDVDDQRHRSMVVGRRFGELLMT